MIPDSFIEQLRYASDIEKTISSYVNLKRRGRNLTGLCPFHSEKTPSFTVYPESQSYYCFGCGKGGDVITFIREVEHLEYVEAIKFLAAKAGMQVPEDAKSDGTARLKARVYELNREAARFFHKQLVSPAGKPALGYLRERGLTDKTIRHFGIGYAPDTWDSLTGHLRKLGYTKDEMLAAAVAASGKNNSCYDLFRGRVIFPIIDLRGNVIGFGGRNLTDRGPKYLNSSDTPVFKKSRNLYALNFAKAVKTDVMLLAEGYMDVIALHQAGFENAVATLGTSLTSEQARLISQYSGKVAIAYDSDSAGQTAAKRAINLFSETGIPVSVLEITGAKDPDEYIKKYGATRFQNLIDGGKSALSFEIDKLRASHDLENAEGKTQFLAEFCKMMAGIDNELQRGVYISQVARELDVGKENILSTTEAIRKKKLYAARKKAAHNLRPYAQDKTAVGAPQSSQSLPGIVAEEKLLVMLVQNPDYYKEIRSNIVIEDFLSPQHRQIYAVLDARLSADLPIDLIYLSSELSPELMSLLSKLVAQGAHIPYYKEQIPEYIRALKAQKDVKDKGEVAQMSPEEYARYITSLADKKK